ncbi:hypothetical protein JW905_04720 [bacterium]|nr:hypothetical protein [candidate division CSSED10-310 bacterium]
MRRSAFIVVTLVVMALLSGFAMAADEAAKPQPPMKPDPERQQASRLEPTEKVVFLVDGKEVKTLKYEEIVALEKPEVDIRGTKRQIGPYLKDVLKAAGITSGKMVRVSGQRDRDMELTWDDVMNPDNKIMVRINDKHRLLSVMNLSLMEERPSKPPMEKGKRGRPDMMRSRRIYSMTKVEVLTTVPEAPVKTTE